jgi:hypothetical protein
MTPFGSPVVPDVYMSDAVSTGDGGSTPGGSEDWASITAGRYVCGWSSSTGEAEFTRSCSTVGVESAISSAMGTYSGSTTSTFDRESFTRNSTSAACHQQLMGPAMAPIFWAPSSTSKTAGEFPSM